MIVEDFCQHFPYSLIFWLFMAAFTIYVCVAPAKDYHKE